MFSVDLFCWGHTFRASFSHGKFIFCALFLCLFTINTHFCSTLIGQNWQLCSLTGSHRGTGGGIQIPETWLLAFSPFLPHHQIALGELALRLRTLMYIAWTSKQYKTTHCRKCTKKGFVGINFWKCGIYLVFDIGPLFLFGLAFFF